MLPGPGHAWPASAVKPHLFASDVEELRADFCNDPLDAAVPRNQSPIPGSHLRVTQLRKFLRLRLELDVSGLQASRRCDGGRTICGRMQTGLQVDEQLCGCHWRLVSWDGSPA